MDQDFFLVKYMAHFCVKRIRAINLSEKKKNSPVMYIAFERREKSDIKLGVHIGKEGDTLSFSVD